MNDDDDEEADVRCPFFLAANKVSCRSRCLAPSMSFDYKREIRLMLLHVEQTGALMLKAPSSSRIQAGRPTPTRKRWRRRRCLRSGGVPVVAGPRRETGGEEVTVEGDSGLEVAIEERRAEWLVGKGARLGRRVQRRGWLGRCGSARARIVWGCSRGAVGAAVVPWPGAAGGCANHSAGGVRRTGVQRTPPLSGNANLPNLHSPRRTTRVAAMRIS